MRIDVIATSRTVHLGNTYTLSGADISKTHR